MKTSTQAKPAAGSSRVERRRARTREALISAAQQLLSTRPAGAVNVDEIAELADVAKGTFYNYFADPDAPSNAGVRRDVHAGVADGRFTGITDEAGVVLVLSVMTGGVNRALDLVQTKKVRLLGESLARALLIALGLQHSDAAKVAARAMALVS